MIAGSTFVLLESLRLLAKFDLKLRGLVIALLDGVRLLFEPLGMLAQLLL